MSKKTDKPNQCEGCISISHQLFPFVNGAEAGSKGEFIDQEGCGIDGNTYLKIKYCPVCGKEIDKQ